MLKEKSPDLFIKVLLGDRLYRLRGSRKEKKALTGLNQQEQIRAERPPYNYDWKLSQIIKLANYYEEDIVCHLIPKIQ